jgi:glycosyltransferase involved in cell wall biosynthesis
MRLAWFSPLPPTKSGIAQYNAELVPSLVAFHRIDLFVDGTLGQVVSPSAHVHVFDAYDFVWKHRRDPYDLIVYQLGNAPCHDYMWSYLTRYPGVVVLHDGQLHHARGRMLLQPWIPKQDEYRREFWFNHPDANPDLAQLGAVGLFGSLTYLWPMLRIVVDTSRRVLVHNDWLAEQIREAHPDALVDVVDMGVPEPAPRPGARQQIRRQHGIPEDAVLFTAFGKVTPEKRVREAMRALGTVTGITPAHLLVAGEPVDYYDMPAEAIALGISDRVTFVGYVPDDEIDDYLAASEVCLCLRWPTSRETSASWLRCLAAGKPTLSTDLVHTVDMPSLDPRDWSILAGLSAVARNEPASFGETRRSLGEGGKAGTTTEVNTVDKAKPVGVSIDILDEDHSLKLAIRRLATDEKLRATLGANARALWMERFRLERMVAGYQAAMTQAMETISPRAGIHAALPEHLRSTGAEHAESLVREILGSEYHFRDAD